MYGAADHQYHIGSTFVDPRGVGVYGYPDAGQAKVGAIGGVPVPVTGFDGAILLLREGNGREGKGKGRLHHGFWGMDSLLFYVPPR